MFCTILGNLDASVTGIDYFLLYPFHFISHYDGIFLISIQFQFVQQSTAFQMCIRDSNIGSVFRTSDAFLVDCIYLCGITATPPHPEMHKTALGAENSVEWRYKKNTLDAVQELHDQGFTVLAIERCV